VADDATLGAANLNYNLQHAMGWVLVTDVTLSQWQGSLDSFNTTMEALRAELGDLQTHLTQLATAATVTLDMTVPVVVVPDIAFDQLAAALVACQQRLVAEREQVDSLAAAEGVETEC
jgi:hypothetical protein